MIIKSLKNTKKNELNGQNIETIKYNTRDELNFNLELYILKLSNYLKTIKNY